MHEFSADEISSKRCIRHIAAITHIRQRLMFRISIRLHMYMYVEADVSTSIYVQHFPCVCQSAQIGSVIYPKSSANTVHQRHVGRPFPEIQSWWHSNAWTMFQSWSYGKFEMFHWRGIALFDKRLIWWRILFTSCTDIPGKIGFELEKNSQVGENWLMTSSRYLELKKMFASLAPRRPKKNDLKIRNYWNSFLSKTMWICENEF